MDLVSTIRKSGSRGGVNFSWDDVSTSAHRENYLGHSLKAPVGRWQKGRDLNWYAKAGESADGPSDETDEQRRERERKEEIRRVKEAEEDALNRALGLPVPDRSQSGGVSSGANNVGLGEVRRMVGEAGVDRAEGKGFGDFVGKTEGQDAQGDVILGVDGGDGGLLGGEARRSDDKAAQRGSHRRTAEEQRERDERRSRRRDRSPGSHRRRRDYRERSRSPRRDDRKRERRSRSRSPDHARRKTHRERDGSREHQQRRRRSTSGDRGQERRDRNRSPHREPRRDGDWSREHGRDREKHHDRRR